VLTCAATYAAGLAPAVGQDADSPFLTSAEPIDEVPEPILLGDFDADGDGAQDLLQARPPDHVDAMPRVGVISEQHGVLNVTYAEQPDDLFGVISRNAGDVNNDGSHDVLCNTFRWDDATGKAHSFITVHSGADGSLLHKFTGEAEHDTFGAAAAPAGDVNLDGVDDILVGAPAGGADSEGYVHVLSGADGALLQRQAGVAPSRGFGAALAGLGDVDGDGRVDDAVSAPGQTSASENVADEIDVVNIYSGATGALLRTIEGDQRTGFGASISAADLPLKS